MTKGIELIQEYYGAVNVIRNKKGLGKVVVFIIDDDHYYLELVKKSLSDYNYLDIYSFTSGEEALNYTSIQPDLVLLDYHLDGFNKQAMKGDKIGDLIQQECPEAKIILISSDEKIRFLNKLSRKDVDFIYKDNYAPGSMRFHAGLAKAKKNTRLHQVIISILVIITVLTFLFQLKL